MLHVELKIVQPSMITQEPLDVVHLQPRDGEEDDELGDAEPKDARVHGDHALHGTHLPYPQVRALALDVHQCLLDLLHPRVEARDVVRGEPVSQALAQRDTYPRGSLYRGCGTERDHVGALHRALEVEYSLLLRFVKYNLPIRVVNIAPHLAFARAPGAAGEERASYELPGLLILDLREEVLLPGHEIKRECQVRGKAFHVLTPLSDEVIILQRLILQRRFRVECLLLERRLILLYLLIRVTHGLVTRILVLRVDGMQQME